MCVFTWRECRCVCVCARARSRVRAGANEIGEIRFARRSADGAGRPSRTRRRIAPSFFHRPPPRRRVLREKRSADGEDNAEVSWRSSGAIFRTSGLILWPGNRIGRRSLWEYPAVAAAATLEIFEFMGNCGVRFLDAAVWNMPAAINPKFRVARTTSLLWARAVRNRARDCPARPPNDIRRRRRGREREDILPGYIFYLEIKFNPCARG